MHASSEIIKAYSWKRENVKFELKLEGNRFYIKIVRNFISSVLATAPSEAKCEFLRKLLPHRR